MTIKTQAEKISFISQGEDVDTEFAKVYSHYFPRVFNYVTYRVADFHTAEDLTSQIFEKLFSNIHYYRSDRGNFSTWIFTIARNTIIDYHRCKKRNLYTPIELIPEIVDSEAGPDDIATFNEIQQHVIKALGFLNEREREIIALKFWGGLTNIDIARFIGISESNTGVVLFRAMKRLRKILESQGLSMLE